MRARHRPAKLPPPSPEDRVKAADAADALCRFWGTREAMGQEVRGIVTLSRTRRSVSVSTWENLPGLMEFGGTFSHLLLPGWAYSRSEVVSEMIPDLRRLAETGERPTEATR